MAGVKDKFSTTDRNTPSEDSPNGLTRRQVDTRIAALRPNPYSSAEKTKLSNIETGATADQTGAEIKAAYEGEDDTNAFTDAEKTKLSGIQNNATAGGLNQGQVDARIAALRPNAFSTTEKNKLSGVEDSATADQTGAEIKVAYEGEDDTNAFTDALLKKLKNIEARATTDQTGAEIKALYEAEDDTNAFTDADKTKLDNVSNDSALFTQIGNDFALTGTTRGRWKETPYTITAQDVTDTPWLAIAGGITTDNGSLLYKSPVFFRPADLPVRAISDNDVISEPILRVDLALGPYNASSSFPETTLAIENQGRKLMIGWNNSFVGADFPKLTIQLYKVR